VVRLDQPEVDAAALVFTDLPLRARGAVEESFRRDLYAFPFGQSFATGYAVAEAPDERAPTVVSDGSDPEPQRWYRRPAVWKWSLGGTAVAALATGVSLELLASRNSDRLDGAGTLTFRQASDLQGTIGWQRAGAGIAFGVAGTAALTSLLLIWLDGAATDGARPGLVAAGALSADGAGLVFRGAF
jgi:hypothetical protein